MIFLDCTLRDGGYYNDWEFSTELINQYLAAVEASGVNVVELGFRSLKNESFKGPCAFSTDEFIRGLTIPIGLSVGVMVNGTELVGEIPQEEALSRLFPSVATDSRVDLVRIACHVHEFERALPSVAWLKSRGYQVGFNLMQVADRTEDDVKTLARLASEYAIDVLYFADSMGSMNPEDTAQFIRWFRAEWAGAVGIHTHDNLGLALSNTLRALDEGVTWVDSTVTGMGRGPGNARTEELALEIADRKADTINIVPLMTLIREHFKPLQARHGWGTNPYYYLAGKYGIHPTYIQEMLSDQRYSDEDILAVIQYLRDSGGKKFSTNNLHSARHFYHKLPNGAWPARDRFEGREVLILGTGPGVLRNRWALERYIQEWKPLVVALNTQSAISAQLIDLRVACHPVRLLADCRAHTQLPQPLITPYSMLPANVRLSLAGKEVLDFGLNIQADKFEFADTHCTTPTSLVMAYAFAVAASGGARSIYLAGFDGYSPGDPRNEEMNKIVRLFAEVGNTPPLIAITPSRYDVVRSSVYGMIQ